MDAEMFTADHPAALSEACGPVGNLVVEGETRFVVNDCDIQEYARALGALANEPDLAKPMGKAEADRLDTWGALREAVQASRALAGS